MNTNIQMSLDEQLLFEEEWIAALKQNPDEPDRAEEWIEAQAWTEDSSLSNV